MSQSAQCVSTPTTVTNGLLVPEQGNSRLSEDRTYEAKGFMDRVWSHYDLGQLSSPQMKVRLLGTLVILGTALLVGLPLLGVLVFEFVKGMGAEQGAQQAKESVQGAVGGLEQQIDEVIIDDTALAHDTSPALNALTEGHQKRGLRTQAKESVQGAVGGLEQQIDDLAVNDTFSTFNECTEGYKKRRLHTAAKILHIFNHWAEQNKFQGTAFASHVSSVLHPLIEELYQCMPKENPKLGWLKRLKLQKRNKKEQKLDELEALLDSLKALFNAVDSMTLLDLVEADYYLLDFYKHLCDEEMLFGFLTMNGLEPIDIRINFQGFLSILGQKDLDKVCRAFINDPDAEEILPILEQMNHSVLPKTLARRCNRASQNPYAAESFENLQAEDLNVTTTPLLDQLVYVVQEFKLQAIIKGTSSPRFRDKLCKLLLAAAGKYKLEIKNLAKDQSKLQALSEQDQNIIFFLSGLVSNNRREREETQRHLSSVIYGDSEELCVKDPGLDCIADNFARRLLDLQNAEPTFLTELVEDIKGILQRRIVNNNKKMRR